MLVLSRRLAESLKIGDDITITIAQIKKQRVKLAIEAPKDILIKRIPVPENLLPEKSD